MPSNTGKCVYGVLDKLTTASRSCSFPSETTKAKWPSCRRLSAKRIGAEMDRLVRLHYGGCVVDESTHGSQFEGMTVRQLVFFAKPTFEELMSRIKHELDWNDESVGMQGRYDVGGGVMSHKFMLDLNGEIEWQTYIDIVLGSHFKSLEVFAWKKDGRIGKKELIDLNESPLIESPISCHELSERCSRKEELIEEDVEGGEGVNDMADVEVREENDPVREEVHAEENVPLSGLALSVPRSAPLWLALRSQPASHPASLLVWALGVAAKSHLSARWAGAECPTVSAIMAGAEVPARKPSRRLAGLGLGGCGQVPPQRQSGWR
uniref:OSJNBa0076N16.5 protein n=1 Tax=Oryza sativa subsp. japonica TaxID=39947 RepID=Q7X8Y4_ORYSJ|nr:OSJNBa0084K20.7 [Oryza sativa Japonica Group]CAE02484.2 OSJNBa0076N16.5 [Oryza sativa Japonica Group]